MSGTSGISIAPASNLADIAAIHALFLEYAESLDFDRCFQGFDAELATLPGRAAAFFWRGGRMARSPAALACGP